MEIQTARLVEVETESAGRRMHTRGRFRFAAELVIYTDGGTVPAGTCPVAPRARADVTRDAIEFGRDIRGANEP